MRVRLVHRYHARELRNGQAHYARRPIYLHSAFGPRVVRARQGRRWRFSLVDAVLLLGLAISALIAIAILCAFALGLFYLAVFIGRVAHTLFGIGGS